MPTNSGGGGPVMFSLSSGVNNTVNTNNNNGFDSPGGEVKPEMSAYKIPPVIWMIVLLAVGYIGLRWVMED